MKIWSDLPHDVQSSFPLEGRDMQRINQFNCYQFGTFLHPLSELQEKRKLRDILFSLFAASTWLEYFLNDRVVPLVVSKAAGWKLYYAIKKILPQNIDQPADKELEFSDIYPIISAVKEFETVFSAELQTHDTYFVSPKGIYSTPDLIERAEKMFPEKILKMIPNQVIVDIRQAGKCLAFDCPTAVGFHLLRAVEAIIVEYYTEVIGKAPKKKERNWWAYIKILRDNNADPKVLAVLDQIRDIHRNPIMHPETVLNIEEATTLLGISQSAIVAMITDIAVRRDAKQQSQPQGIATP